MSEPSNAFSRLVRIMDELREQCPWDRKQTIGTLRPLTIEETYELADADHGGGLEGDKGGAGGRCCCILSSMPGSDGSRGKFTLDEVIDGICDKLISRHPHIYGTTAQEGLVEVKNEEDVKRNWEQLKLKEGKKSVTGRRAGLACRRRSRRRGCRRRRGRSDLNGRRRRRSGRR